VSGLIHATSIWDDIEYPKNHGMGYGPVGVSKIDHLKTDPGEIMTCRTCPLPCDWCVGGEDNTDVSPCPLVRVKRDVPPFEREELDALWAADAAGMQYKDERGYTTPRAKQLLNRLHEACVARHIEREAQDIIQRDRAHAVKACREVR